MVNIRFSALLSVLLVAACANPVVVAPVGPEEQSKNCSQLDYEIAQAKHYRKEARAEDGFRWKYIGVVNGFVSAYRINKAEEAAQTRINQLEQIAKEKECPVIDMPVAAESGAALVPAQ